MMKHLYFFLCLLVLTSACNKKLQTQTNNNSNDPLAEFPGPAIRLNGFPLKPGNMWVYDNGDTLRVVADTIINGMAAEKLVKTNHSSTQTSYYANRPDGLYLLGTDARPYSLESPYGFVPQAPVVFDVPMLIVRYAINFNEPWNTNEPNMKYAQRNWVGFVTVTNKAGTFNCAKLRSLDGSATEYYSEKGLMRSVEQPECFTAPCPPVATNLIYVNF